MGKKTKLADKKVYAKWYKVAQDTIKNDYLIPERSDTAIFSLVSQENWLVFALKGTDKEEVISGENPNVFLNILSKEGNLIGKATIGLTFNNLKAYDKFKTIMRGYNQDLKNKITQSLLKLKRDWKITIEKKIKEFNYAQTPTYIRVKEWASNKIDNKIIDEIIEISKNIREEGKIISEKRKSQNKFYRETPNINLMESTFELNEEEFKSHVLEVFEVLALCLNVKTDIEINKLKRESEKELKNKEQALNSAKEHKKKIEFFEKMSPDKLKIGEKQEVLVKIKGLENEIETLKRKIDHSK